VHRRVCELLQQAIQQAQRAKPGSGVVTMAEVAEAVLSPHSDASDSARTWSLGASSASSSLHDQEQEAEAPEACLSSASDSPHSEPLQLPAFSPTAAAGRGGGGGGSAASEKHHHEQEAEEQRRLEQLELHEKLARQLLKQLVQEPGSPASGAADSPRPDLHSGLFCTSPPHHYTGALPLSRRNSVAAGQGGGGKPQPADVAADHQHRQEAFMQVRGARAGGWRLAAAARLVERACRPGWPALARPAAPWAPPA
jgi:hypothetical protein